MRVKNGGCEIRVNNVGWEVMVVVHGTMLKYHGKSVQHYVLTLMQIVSLTLLVLLLVIFILCRWT